jgi:hypothetical protein
VGRSKMVVMAVAADPMTAAERARPTRVYEGALASINLEGFEKDVEVIEKFGGDDGARTRDLRRDRPAF